MTYEDQWIFPSASLPLPCSYAFKQLFRKVFDARDGATESQARIVAKRHNMGIWNVLGKTVSHPHCLRVIVRPGTVQAAIQAVHSNDATTILAFIQAYGAPSEMHSTVGTDGVAPSLGRYSVLTPKRSSSSSCADIATVESRRSIV